MNLFILVLIPLDPSLQAEKVDDPHLRPRSLNVIGIDRLHAPVQSWGIDHESRGDIECVRGFGQAPILDDVVLLVERRASGCLQMIVRCTQDGCPREGKVPGVDGRAVFQREERMKCSSSWRRTSVGLFDGKSVRDLVGINHALNS